MPKCSKCNAVQAQLNKGALCKKCFNNKINPTDVNMINDESIEIDPISDRSIIDLIKSQMVKETQWNNEINQVFKDQIVHLKSEIKHKNYIIKNLIKSNHYNYNREPIVNSNNNYFDKDDASTIITDSPIIHEKNHVSITPDDSMSNNEVYNIVEHDDIFSASNNEWKMDKRKRRINQNYCIPEHNAKIVEHENRFNGLNVNDNGIIATAYDVTDKPEPIRVNINRFQNNITQSNKSKKTNRPHIVTQNYPENNFIRQPIRPGENAYNEAVKYGKTTVVFSTSMTKGINVRNFNNNYKLGTARFRRFPGAKSKQLKHYVLPTLTDDKPQVVLLQCGGNDLPTGRANPTPVEDVANEIIEIAKTCENYGVENILISSVITRKQDYMDRRRKELNDLLIEMCYNLGFIYIDNDNIKHEHLYHDGVHLNHDGSNILSNNYLHSLNNLF